MKENNGFKTPIVPVLLMVAGLIHFTQDMLLSTGIGICVYAIIYFADRGFKNGR